jgi:hypothetical protein
VLTNHRNTRDNSGHSVHPYKFSELERPELVYRVFPTRYRKSRLDGGLARDCALDCAVLTKRPMSPARRSVA